MADETPAAPAPVDPWSMTPDQATATLAQMQIDAHPPAPLNPTTPQDARRRLDELTSNKEWGARWVAGGIAEGKEYARLSELANQADEVKDAINNTTPESQSFSIETTTPGQLNRRDLASVIDTFRDSGLSDDSIAQALNGSKVSRAEYMAAKALKSARHGDAAWRQRWLNGGWAEGREQWLLNIVLSSEIEDAQ
jgi:hypothetical protein